MYTKRIEQHMKKPFYAFIHFGINTFTGREWGDGKESPNDFALKSFDAKGIAEAVKSAGMTGLVLTAKHHDGFCLWQTKTTKHSIKNSPYKEGKGDIVLELSRACQDAGLSFGVYLSPWDRNSELYGTDKYNAFYLEQLRELLTNYGELFYVWFDGACADDKKQVYDFESFFALVRELQPKACMFSDNGPDIAWIGNEDAKCSDEIWLKDGFMPYEADVSIRKGWFYHEDENPKSAEELFDLYLGSVGKGCCLHLNIPPNKYGKLDEKDVFELRRLGSMLNKAFVKEKYNKELEFDKNGEISLSFDKALDINYISIEENLYDGQNINGLDIYIDKIKSFSVKTIGAKRLLRVDKTAETLRLKLAEGSQKNIKIRLLVF